MRPFPTGNAVRVALPQRKLRYREGGDNSACRAALEVDFARRCAYCMHHLDDSESPLFEIDHFRPRKSKGSHSYLNLRLACHWCNLYKGMFWPAIPHLAAGQRLLDPCNEVDYGVHLFEIPAKPGEIEATGVGKFHVERLRLNRRPLQRKRLAREKKREQCEMLSRALGEPRVPAATRIEIEALLRELRRELALMPPRFER
jgi:hypothetical protein